MEKEQKEEAVVETVEEQKVDNKVEKIKVKKKSTMKKQKRRLRYEAAFSPSMIFFRWSY